jgi:hypothetical protein
MRDKASTEQKQSLGVVLKRPLLPKIIVRGWKNEDFLAILVILVMPMIKIPVCVVSVVSVVSDDCEAAS